MNKHKYFADKQHGMTLVELMVALAIGSFLVIGAVQVYNQSRQAYVINESIARVQETAQFAMDTLEADLRMASNFGRVSRGDTLVSRSVIGDANPDGLTLPTPNCGAAWAFDVARPVNGSNNGYNLACGAIGGAAQGNSDTITIRRGSLAPAPLTNGTLQLVTNRMTGGIVDDGTLPPVITNPLTAVTHNLVVNSYYVAANSQLIPGAPTLRMKSLVTQGGAPAVVDFEVAPGVENLQVQFGVDMNGDSSVDRYVNPDDQIITPGAAGFVPAANVVTARVWLVVRSIGPETGIIDNTDYEPGDVDLGVQADEFRRMIVSKTILLRNSRS